MRGMEIKQGMTVCFKGGLGRGNHYDEPGAIHCGIVNGEPIERGDGAILVPVHVPSFNHNLIVARENIVKDDAA